MAHEEEFVIENGVLKAYKGTSWKVVVPEGVTEIGLFAFAHCEWVGEIVLPEGLKRIGRRAFFTAHFTRIEIPASVRVVERRAFECCRNLAEVVFRGEEVKLERLAFSYFSTFSRQKERTAILSKLPFFYDHFRLDLEMKQFYVFLL